MNRTQITRALEVLETPAPGVQELLLTTGLDGTPDGRCRTSIVANLNRADARALFDALGAWLLDTAEDEQKYLAVVHEDAVSTTVAKKDGTDVLSVQWAVHA